MTQPEERTCNRVLGCTRKHDHHGICWTQADVLRHRAETQAAVTTGQQIDPAGVNHPAHYNSDPSGVECIQVVRHRTFNVGNAMKYLWRAGLKVELGGDPAEKQIQDLKKAAWYIQDEIERLENEAKEESR